MNIQGLGTSAIINVKVINDILSKLNIGDKITVQVSGIGDGELILRLPNGSTVAAACLAPMDVLLGDFLELSVKNKFESQVVLETVKNSQDIVKNNIIKTLVDINLPPDERNIQIGKQLLDNNLPLNKENIKSVINFASKFEGIDVKKAVFILANNLDKLNDSIKLLNKFAAKQAKIGETINKLTNLLIENFNADDMDKVFKNYQRNVSTKLIENENITMKAIIGDYGNSDGENNLVHSIIRQVINKINQPESNGINKIFKHAEAFLNKNFTPQDVEILLNNIDINKGSVKEFIEKNPLIKEKMILLLNNKPELKSFVLKHIDNTNTLIFDSKLEKSDTPTKIKNFLNIVNVIKDGRIKTDINVNKLYNDLILKLELIEHHAKANNITNSKEILNTVFEVKNSAEFMNNVNNSFMYFQIPFIINKMQTNVEFYIKNTKKSSKIDPKNATVFVSLNTANLGVVESLITIYNKDISIKFKLEDNKTIDFFKKQVHVLQELLSNKGFKLSRVNYEILKEQADILNFNSVLKEQTIVNMLDVRI